MQNTQCHLVSKHYMGMGNATAPRSERSRVLTNQVPKQALSQYHILFWNRAGINTAGGLHENKKTH